MPTLIDVGRVIAGKYELLRLLGRGSMGSVWTAQHMTLGQRVAIKFLQRSDVAEDPVTAAARFRREAQITARLSRNTRHVVHVTDHGEEDGVAYLVMEFLEGETLERRLLRRGPMGLDETCKLVAQIARALAEAHAEGVVHRDLKPGNVFLTRDEDGEILVKVLDFGIARSTGPLSLLPKFQTGQGLALGTPGYVSPEQACASDVDQGCDLWALATIAYEALTAELPVPGSSDREWLDNLRAGRIVPIHQRNPELPLGLASFFQAAFAERIEARFPTALALATALERATRTTTSPQELALVHAGALGSTRSSADGPATVTFQAARARRGVWRPLAWTVAAGLLLALGGAHSAQFGPWHGRTSIPASPPALVAAPNPLPHSPVEALAAPPPSPPMPEAAPAGDLERDDRSRETTCADARIGAASPMPPSSSRTRLETSAASIDALREFKLRF